MRERLDLSDLAKVLSARRLQELAARLQLSAAAAESRRRETESSEAAAEVQDSLARWSAHLDSEQLDRDQVTRFAADVGFKHATLVRLKDRLNGATQDAQLAQRSHALAAVRTVHAAKMLRRALRKKSRKDEEQSLRSLEDRITSARP